MEFCTIFFVSSESKAWSLVHLFPPSAWSKMQDQKHYWVVEMDDSNWNSMISCSCSVSVRLFRSKCNSMHVWRIKACIFFTSIVSYYLLCLNLALLLLNLLNSWVLKSQSLSVLSSDVLHFFLALGCWHFIFDKLRWMVFWCVMFL